MRSYLNKLYLLSGYASGLCIILIMLIILTQIVGRLLGFIIPSADDFSGYALVSATFLGLAYTFHEGGHIRVTLMIQGWSKQKRFYQELTVLLFAAALSTFMTFYIWYMVWESYIFEEVSHGYIPVPLWLPQIPMGMGITVLSIAVFDDLYRLIKGDEPSYVPHENDISLEDV